MGLSTYDDSSSSYVSDDDDCCGGSTSGEAPTEPSSASKQGQDNDHDAPLSMTARETVAVNRSKMLVYTALLLAAVAVGTTIYILLSREEEDDFEAQFRSFSREIIDVATSNAGAVFADAAIMSTAITSYAKTVNTTWPFLTLPDFERRLDDGVIDFNERNPTLFCPLVEDKDVQAWEDYAILNQNWIREGLSTQGHGDFDPGRVPMNIHPLQILLPPRFNDAGEELQQQQKQEEQHHGHGQGNEAEAEEAVGHHGTSEEDSSGGHHGGHGGHGGTDHRAHAGRRTLRELGRSLGNDAPVAPAAIPEIPFAAAPIWQVEPAPRDVSIINGDVLSNDMLKEMVAVVVARKHQLLSESVHSFVQNKVQEEGGHHDFHDHHEEHHQGYETDDPDPYSYLIQPVFDTFDETTQSVVGVILGEIAWGEFLDKILPPGLNGFVVVVSDQCGSYETFVINGPGSERLGAGQLHDRKYDYLRVRSDFASSGNHGHERSSDNDDGFRQCNYHMEIYPSDELRARYISNKPALYTGIVMLVFLCTIAVFVVYDWLVQLRQYKLVKTATRTSAIVSSLFPRDVQRRIMEEAEHQERDAANRRNKGAFGLLAPRSQLKDFLSDDADANDRKEDRASFTTSGGGIIQNKPKPIADLFPDVTVMFADIVGFTAWSSTREPAQVFTLLEAIYNSFDYIAKERNIFKVETVGDCYVAVAGLPDPRKDHCVAMARCARDCLLKLSSLVKHLEVELGPDTADLGMRFGLHSGQVTAGVLRGQRARFQLFGDTMNVAARMESTGERNKIHCSGATAGLLIASGKGHWVTARNGLVPVKGKGELQTYWVFAHRDSAKSNDGATTETESCADTSGAHHCLGAEMPEDDSCPSVPSKIHRLADWNTTVLLARLKGIVARRAASGTRPAPTEAIEALEQASLRAKTCVMEETTEIVKLPHFDPQAAKKQKDPQSVQLSEQVIAETSDFVRTIAQMYRSNPFHNFEHASHVMQSTEKLLWRIVAPDLTDKVESHDNFDSALDDHTYGITSDPWTQFTVVLAALIHDVDHPGVPNSTLIKEGSAMAAAYNKKSIAESNSIDLAWDLLMDDRYKNLRHQIYCTQSEFQHFRSLLVNTVLATDIMDKELSGLRKARWNKAFSEDGLLNEDAKVTKDRKATIVIEHLIQASDVAHTMQHWHIFTKWNRRLFEEVYVAYLDGRSDTDPSEAWYEGEIGFLDFYVIPLAKKLQSCGVFGVSSSEYLTYAQLNREEWQRKGKEIVEDMVEHVKGSRVSVPAASLMARKDWELRGSELVQSKGGSSEQCSADVYV